MTAAGEQYAARRADLFELIRSLPDEAMSMAVPATPGWSVHDVVSHLAGVAADNVRGALPDDERMPTLDAWTSRQVAERADTPTADVLSEWEESSAAFEALIDRDGRSLPAALMDLVTHYDDLKHAVDALPDDGFAVLEVGCSGRQGRTPVVADHGADR